LPGRDGYASGTADGRIVIISASIGAGHDGVAAELARRLIGLGFRVDRRDFLDLLPGPLGRLLRRAYALELKHAPSTWDWLYTQLDRHPWMSDVAAWLSGMASGGIRRITGDGCVAVVSTYPLASQVLGSMRQSGRLSVPAVTYLCDFSVHRLWVHPGIDGHLAVHKVAAGQAEALGAKGLVVISPAVAPAFGLVSRTPGPRPGVRERFGLPAQGELALILAGSWAVGDVELTAREVLSSGLATPVVVCGRNTALYERLTRLGIGIALGWVDDMAGLLGAVDVVVHNAGGLSCLEALATEVPVLVYRCIPGHGHTNAAALVEAGLTVTPANPQELATMLAAALDGGLIGEQRAATAELYAAPDPAAVVASMAGTPSTGRGRSIPVWRMVASVVALALASLWVANSGSSIFSPEGYQCQPEPGVAAAPQPK